VIGSTFHPAAETSQKARSAARSVNATNARLARLEMHAREALQIAHRALDPAIADVQLRHVVARDAAGIGDVHRHAPRGWPVHASSSLRRIDTRRRPQDGDGGQHRHEQDAEEHHLMGYRTAFARASETSPVPDVSRRAVMPRVA
jgi:hypothetical protein